jgi:hypothetical protein
VLRASCFVLGAWCARALIRRRIPAALSVNRQRHDLRPNDQRL